jgi:hypothetical protein
MLLDDLIRMTDIDYAQWWIGAVFRGDSGLVPRVVATPDEMLKLVAANRDAIGVLMSGDVRGADVTIVPVDGKTPADRDYPFRPRRF